MFIKFINLVVKIKKRILSWVLADRKIIFASLLLGFLFTSAVTYSVTYSEGIQKGIAKEVLRFHVLANSDEDYDQKLKLKVRDEILNKYYNELKKCENVEETKLFFEDNIGGVISTAKEVIQKEGFNYDVKAFIGKSSFLTKKYGDVSFPAGEYDALKIEIGDANGKNWWCVMFPPLCFVDVSHSSVSESSKNELENILTEEEYGIVANSQSDNSFKVKFKVVELWEELFS